MSKKEILLIVIVVVIVAGVLVVIGLMRSPKCKPVNLEIWGVYDEPEVFADFIDQYKKTNKCVVGINYQKKDPNSYEQELINALAIDKGSDIWMMHNTWLPKHENKIAALPENLFSYSNFLQTYVDVAGQDLTKNNRIFGIPLYVDTLALFYNRNYFNSAGIASPPETWEDLVDGLDNLIKKTAWGSIERAGIAIGTAENVNRASDILALLMLQNGTKMTSDDKKSVNFTESINLRGETYYPAKEALRFYTDFSNPTKNVYTWNRQMPYSIDAFADSKAAMLLGYAHYLPILNDKNPYLDFRIAPMPQIKGSTFDINYANYWAFTVSKKSKAQNEAWKFILYLGQKANSQRYLQLTKRPTSRRDLIAWQKKDNLDLAIFAEQSLTARSWYQIDSGEIEKIFNNAIESVVLGSATYNRAIENMTNQVNLLMKK
jgi:multiple sugar transport system substrate-binding protein